MVSPLMYKAVSVTELLFGDIQSWLEEEAILVMKGEKNISGPWDQKKKETLCNNVFWCTPKLEVSSSGLSYLRMD